MAYDATADNKGRQIKALAGNEAEDGSGVWHCLVSDTSGLLKVSLQSLLDDVPLQLGTGGTVKILYETADANANAIIFVAPEGGAVDVPVYIFGDASIDNADLGFFNGVTEPTIGVVNDAADAYVSLDAGDDAVAGSKGLYFKAAADEDIELLNLSVTGTPRIYWDESEDQFRSTKGWVFDAACDVQGTWVASAAWTLPAFTLGGAITGAGQEVNNLGHIGVKTNISADAGIYYTEDWTLTDNSIKWGFYNNLSIVKTTAVFTGAVIGGSFRPNILAANNQNWTLSTGGIIGLEILPTIVTGATGTLTLGVGVSIQASFQAMTVTDWYGLQIVNPVGVGTLTNLYGILVADMTKGGTIDCGIAIEGADTVALWVSSAVDTTDAPNGIMFGASRDTNLYRSAANVLKTDDTFNAAAYQVAGTQVVGARVVDARCDDVINSGDAVTDGVIDSLRDAMITHGLLAAA